MSDLVVYVSKNHIEVLNLQDARLSAGSAPFTTTRLLVGNFPEAEALLSRLVKDVHSSGLLSMRPRLVIQPLDMTEGGLSAVEERMFLELGTSAGARCVKVHVGAKLSVQSASALLSGRV